MGTEGYALFAYYTCKLASKVPNPANVLATHKYFLMHLWTQAAIYVSEMEPEHVSKFLYVYYLIREDCINIKYN